MKTQMKLLLLTTTILQLSFILPTSSQTTIDFLSLASPDSQNAFSITPPEYYMLTVYGIGDINGDGISDLIITQPINYVYVLYGGVNRFKDFVVPSWNDSTPFSGYRIRLDRSYDVMHISSFGDFNNDGINDMVFQVRPQRAETQIEGVMIYGKKSRGFHDIIFQSTLTVTDGFRIYAKGSKDYSITSYSVIRTGDINNDGMDDAIIRIQQQMSWFGSGMLYTLYGNARISDDINLEDVPSSSKFPIYDHDPDEMVSIDWIGDINHDGVDDFAARSSTDGGDLYVIYGRIGGLSEMNVSNISSSQGFRIRSDDPYYKPNYYFKHAGDLNGDGITDLLIGAEKNSVFKPVYIIYGKTSNFSDIVLEKLTSSDGFKIVESAGRETLGTYSSHIGDIGDINNDGFDDILIISTDKITRSNKGYIIFGQKDRRPDIDVTAAENILAIEFNANYSFVPLRTGDLNGDGIDDLAVKTYYTLFGLYGSNCHEYTDCLSPMPTICYASKGCACSKRNMIMQDLYCVSSCSPGYYQAPDSTCKVCSMTCKACSSNPSCDTCFDGYLLQDSLCVSSCSDGYLQIGSICQSTKMIFGATAGAVTAIVMVIIAIVYIRRRKKHAAGYNNTISFPAVRFESEIEMRMSTTPSHLGKDSYLEQPIERVQDNNDPHPEDDMGEEENENNNEEERMDLKDQQQAEYEVQAKRAV